MILPLCLFGLVVALVLTGFARLGGSPASRHQPYPWDGGAVFVTGGSEPGVYATCTITPAKGERRTVDIPGSDRGLHLEPWFDGPARISCGRSVSVTSGWQTVLYPYAFDQLTIFVLMGGAVGAWWFGRRSRLH